MFHVMFSCAADFPPTFSDSREEVRRPIEWEMLCNREFSYRFHLDWSQINTMYNQGPVFFSTF